MREELRPVRRRAIVNKPQVMFDLTGRHLLVTGGGRGIGRASALALAAAGAGVTVVARSEGELQETVTAIEAQGGTADFVVADVTDAEAVDRAVGDVAARPGFWGCVNAAGTNRPGASASFAIEDWDAVLEVNLRATFLVCRAVGRALLAGGGGGRLINISSQMGSVGYPGRAAYCASKHAVNGLTKALAVEWAAEGITVNAVAPTFIETPMTQPMLADPEFHQEVVRRIPAGRVGTVDDVVGAVVYLASGASSLVTGHILAVDGGWVAW